MSAPGWMGGRAVEWWLMCMVRDAGSDEMVFYRDTNGEWTAEKDEVSQSSSINPSNPSSLTILSTSPQLVYMDFKPKVWKTGNDTVTYKVKTC